MLWNKNKEQIHQKKYFLYQLEGLITTDIFYNK